jgi:hypothetical protein
MTKIAGSGSKSGSGSISQRHGSADPDPDPPQNVMDPQHWQRLRATLTVSADGGGGMLDSNKTTAKTAGSLYTCVLCKDYRSEAIYPNCNSGQVPP